MMKAIKLRPRLLGIHRRLAYEKIGLADNVKSAIGLV
jgi:hypothetical protein